MNKYLKKLFPWWFEDWDKVLAQKEKSLYRLFDEAASVNSFTVKVLKLTPVKISIYDKVFDLTDMESYMITNIRIGEDNIKTTSLVVQEKSNPIVEVELSPVRISGKEVRWVNEHELKKMIYQGKPFIG